MLHLIPGSNVIHAMHHHLLTPPSGGAIRHSTKQTCQSILLCRGAAQQHGAQCDDASSSCNGIITVVMRQHGYHKKVESAVAKTFI